jgi:chromosomal replication initiator protein
MNSLAIPHQSGESINPNFSENGINYNFKSNSKNQNAFLTYIWEQFLILFEKEKGKKIINNWLKSLEILHWNNQKKIISIYTPNNFIKEWIETHFLYSIEKIFSRLLNENNVTIQFILKQTDNENNINNLKEKRLSDLLENNTGINKKMQNKKNMSIFFDQYINANYNMEHFLITKSNETVISAIQYFIEKNESWHTILYIYGEKSIGKTHLLQGMRSLFLQKNIPAAYISADIFLKQYINAAKTKSIADFEQKFNTIDLLIIDDIEFLNSKKYTQEFLIKIINEFTMARKKIIFSSNAIPKNIFGLSSILCSKLEQGLIFHFDNHSKNDIKNILLLKMQINNYTIPENLVNYILNIDNITISQAESIMHRIMAESIIKKEPLSLDLLINSIKELNFCNNNDKIKYKNIHEIMNQISNHTQIPISQIQTGKNKSIIKIKYLSIYILRIIMKFPCLEVAQYFKYKDHTTLSYACKTFVNLYKDTEEMTKVLSLFI